jgi:hypothetical protein
MRFLSFRQRRRRRPAVGIEPGFSTSLLVSGLAMGGEPGLTDMSWEHAAEARQALNAIVSDPQHGVAALSSAQTMSNLLKDLLPDAPREKSILVAAAEAGLADTLRQHIGEGMDPNMAIRLTASSLSSTTPFTSEACAWVTGEIATAIGISHTADAAGGVGGTPARYDQVGQAAPTQIAPIPGSGYAPGQQPTQGIQQAAGPAGYGAAPTTPGAWQAGQPGQPGQQGGFPQQQPGGFGQGQPAAGGWQGQPQQAGFGQVQPGAGFGQAGGGGWQPGAPVGYAPGGFQPGVPTGPMGPIIPGSPGGPVRPRGRGRAIAIAIGVVAVGVVAIVIAASLASGGGPKANPSPQPASTHASPNPTTPVASPTPVHPAGAEPLATIMNPAGETPVGTDCGKAHLFTLKRATVVASTFCFHSHGVPNVEVWGYQFDSYADYKAGVAHINHYVGFDKFTPGNNCPPPSGSTVGQIGWHTITNPKYKKQLKTQVLECLIDNQKPVLIWTLPTQDVFFIGQDRHQGSPLGTLIHWWKKLSYG